jgi:23S rRNA (pseudouridine1915-N3)-methyltransferase
MKKITILGVGKEREPWLDEAVSEYIGRLSAGVRFEFQSFEDTEKLEKELEKEQLVILLEQKGKMFSSRQFSEFLFLAFARGSSKITFAIGGPEGFSEEIRQKYPRLSLSRLTHTHQICRLILVEQLNRAFEIRKQSAYKQEQDS